MPLSGGDAGTFSQGRVEAGIDLVAPCAVFSSAEWYGYFDLLLYQKGEVPDGIFPLPLA